MAEAADDCEFQNGETQGSRCFCESARIFPTLFWGVVTFILFFLMKDLLCVSFPVSVYVT